MAVSSNLVTNQDSLVQLSCIGEISSPSMKGPYRVHPEGRLEILPSVGGITYGCHIGTPCVTLAADHIEPAVSIKNTQEGPNMALQILACIGNKARVVTGDAKGSEGVVIGKHGGVNHVMVDFSDDVMERLTIGDRIQVKTWGTGLRLVDCGDVIPMNISPALFAQIFTGRSPEGKLIAPVTHLIPSFALGAGLGEDNAYVGDVDIQLHYPEAESLNNLRFGDLVAMVDCDHSWGRIHYPGSVSIGVVVHSAATNAGHGPGVTTVLTSRLGLIQPVLDPEANISRYLHGIL